jgi:hypothetical protein
MKKMRIRIGKDGKATIAVEGAVGTTCLEFTKQVEEALGNVDKRVYSEAYHQDELVDTLSANLTQEESL